MDKYRSSSLPLMIIISIILMVGCGGDDSDRDTSAPSVWFKTYSVLPSGSEDNGRSVKQTADGGYIIAGSSEFSGRSNGTLIKTDSTGKIEWESFLDPASSVNDYGRSVQQTEDGGYIILGEYIIGSNNRQMWLIKTDSHGVRQWDRFYGYDSYEEYAAEVQQTEDGGYILVGTTLQNPSNIFLVRTDMNGNVVWYKQKGYDDSGESGNSVRKASDGGFVLTGWTNQFDRNQNDIWLVKVDASGNTVWHHHYGVSGLPESGNSVRQAKDGGYIVACSTWTSGKKNDISLLKTDSAGKLQWLKTLGGLETDWAAEVELTEDGGYVIAGHTSSYGAGAADGYLIKTDAGGDTLWTNTFGGPGKDYFSSVEQTRDGGYIMTGSTESYGDDPVDIFLVKTNAAGSSLP